MSEQLTPEDFERIARIEAETAAEAERENAGIAGAKAYLALFCAFACFPVLIWPLLTIWFGSLPVRAMGLMWMLAPFELPAIALAAMAWRRGRLRLPNGRVYEGRILRIGLAVAVLAPLLLGLAWELLRDPLTALAHANPFLSELFFDGG